MAVSGIPFKGNAAVSFNSQSFGGLRTAAVSATQGTWDSTAFDNTSGTRTKSATYNDASVTMGGVFDSTPDAGQTTLGAVIMDGAAHALVVTFASGLTFTTTAICTAFDMEGDYEGGWMWTASFEQSAAPTWDLAVA